VRIDSRDAFATLHEALCTAALLLAPLAPFLSDWLFRSLSGRSAHLADFPSSGGRIDPELEREMHDIRELAVLGRAAREQENLRVRQPLRTLKAVVSGGRRPSPEVLELLAQELNVKRVEFMAAGDDIVRLAVKPNFGRLGPRFGSETPKVAALVRQLDQQAAGRLQAGQPIQVRLDGRSVEIEPDEVTIAEEASGDLVIKSSGGYLVGLDCSVDDELRAEGMARELVNRVQRLRRDVGLEVSDRIELEIRGADVVEAAARAHRDYIAGETLAVRVRVGAGSRDEGAEWLDGEIDGHPVRIGLARSR
jgi:isoleucyl-tRNA synthetase